MKSRKLLGAGALLVATAMVALAADTTRQAHVHEMSGHVMPFEMSKAMHVFEMTETGGIMSVIAKDPGDAQQVQLIQQHLRHESQLFQQGDFSDPMTLHGHDMPGLREMSAAAGKISVTYATQPDGAQITFTAHDIHFITAIHRWFGAQLSDHGADATSR